MCVSVCVRERECVCRYAQRLRVRCGQSTAAHRPPQAHATPPHGALLSATVSSSDTGADTRARVGGWGRGGWWARARQAGRQGRKEAGREGRRQAGKKVEREALISQGTSSLSSQNLLYGPNLIEITNSLKLYEMDLLSVLMRAV